MSRRLKNKIQAVLKRESGTVFKDPGGRINIALAYPNLYRVGMSNLGFQGIYGLLNSQSSVVCERVFLPDNSDLEEYLRSNSPIMSMESQRPLTDFHVVAFSVSYENDYPNILRILDLAGIPKRTADRTEHHPLLILGGICTAYNPEPMADFFDVIFIGEAEKSLPIFLTYLDSIGLQRHSLLSELSGIEGIYVPSLYQEIYSDSNSHSNNNDSFLSKLPLENAPALVKKGRPADLDETRLISTINTTDSEFSRMCLIEGMRGCPWSCRFCVASHAYRPVRFRSREVLDEMIREASKRFPKIGLVGPSMSDYRGIDDLIRSGTVNFSISSLRAWGRSKGLIKVLADKGQKSLSIAPEAGSERMRRVVKKHLTEVSILETADLILSLGISQLRLYFMIGLPTETTYDVDAIAKLAAKIRSMRKGGTIVLSVSCFVPKPFTPFQWMAMEGEKILKKKLARIKELLKGIAGITIVHDPPKTSCIEAFLSRGDRRVSRAIEEIAASQGKSGDWRKSSLRVGINPEIYAHRRREFKEPLPWDFIDSGIDKAMLEEECRKALSER